MSWGCHPDTLTMAQARGFANRSGHQGGTTEWLRVYRDAYERAADGSYPESLAEYLADLDRRIAGILKEEPTSPPIRYWLCSHNGSYPLAGHFRGDGPGSVLVLDVVPCPDRVGVPFWIEFQSSTADPTRVSGLKGVPDRPCRRLDFRQDFTLTLLEPIPWQSTAPRIRETTGSP